MKVMEICTYRNWVIFQWMSEEQSYLKGNDAVKNLLSEELADLFLYSLRLSDRLGVDIIDSGLKKIQVNEGKYPITSSKPMIIN